MATQAIRFIGPPGQTITLDVFTLSSDTADLSVNGRRGIVTNTQQEYTAVGELVN